MSDPIRVLHVIGVMNRGGAETMIMNLYRNIDRSKVQFDFVENEGKTAIFDDEIRALGGKIYHCPWYRGKNHLEYTKWWNSFFEAHRGEYPIVHGHIGSTAAIYLSIAKKYRVYTIAHSHNTRSSVLYQVFSFPTRFIADHFFACSKDAGTSRYGKHVGNDNVRCTVLHNAIETNRFVYNKEARQQTRSSLGIRDAQFVIGNISRFAKQKNHRFLIDVFEKIHAKISSAVLLLVGDGELRSEIEAYIAEKELVECVILTGVQSNTWDYYQAMDVFLMPSLYEGLPVSLVEAQTAGLPCCVSTSVPVEAAITDLVQFYSLNESAEQWADWVLECRKMSRTDMKKIMQQAGYDISETAKWLEDYYTEVVKNHG